VKDGIAKFWHWFPLVADTVRVDETTLTNQEDGRVHVTGVRWRHWWRWCVFICWCGRRTLRRACAAARRVSTAVRWSCQTACSACAAVAVPTTSTVPAVSSSVNVLRHHHSVTTSYVQQQQQQQRTPASATIMTSTMIGVAQFIVQCTTSSVSCVEHNRWQIFTANSRGILYSARNCRRDIISRH